jgi:hypothetical protein
MEASTTTFLTTCLGLPVTQDGLDRVLSTWGDNLQVKTSSFTNLGLPLLGNLGMSFLWIAALWWVEATKFFLETRGNASICGSHEVVM